MKKKKSTILHCWDYYKRFRTVFSKVTFLCKQREALLKQQVPGPSPGDSTSVEKARDFNNPVLISKGNDAYHQMSLRNTAFQDTPFLCIQAALCWLFISLKPVFMNTQYVVDFSRSFTFTDNSLKSETPVTLGTRAKDRFFIQT